jgi:hypothetical protein
MPLVSHAYSLEASMRVTNDIPLSGIHFDFLTGSNCKFRPNTEGHVSYNSNPNERMFALFKEREGYEWVSE